MNENDEYINAEIAYLDDDSEIINHHIYPFSSGKEIVRSKQKFFTKKIINIRNLNHKLDIDKFGFTYDSHVFETDNLYDNEFVQKVYYKEMSEYLKSKLNAKDVIFFDHNQRSKPKSEQGVKNIRIPVLQSHVDYTIKSGPKRVIDILKDNKRTIDLNTRYSLINIWRPIKGPVEEMPLALCDGKTVENDDLIETNIYHYSEDNVKTPSHSGQIYSLKFNEKHTWYFLDKMETNEILILKNWDSSHGNYVLNSPHTSFIQPNQNKTTLPRESIEIRSLVIF